MKENKSFSVRNSSAEVVQFPINKKMVEKKSERFELPKTRWNPKRSVRTTYSIYMSAIELWGPFWTAADAWRAYLDKYMARGGTMARETISDLMDEFAMGGCLTVHPKVLPLPVLGSSFFITDQEREASLTIIKARDWKSLEKAHEEAIPVFRDGALSRLLWLLIRLERLSAGRTEVALATEARHMLMHLGSILGFRALAGSCLEPHVHTLKAGKDWSWYLSHLARVRPERQSFIAKLSDLFISARLRARTIENP